MVSDKCTPRIRLLYLAVVWPLSGLVLVVVGATRLGAQSGGSGGSITTVINVPDPSGPGQTVDPTSLATPPSIVDQPRSHTIAPGASFVLSVGATGSDLTYQWALQGKPIAGAVAPSYILFGSSISDLGVYTVTVSNAQGSVVSAPALIQLGTGVAGFLSNLSARSTLGRSSLTGGFSVGGQGSEPFLIRGIGSTLTNFGVLNAAWVTDLEVYSSAGTNLATFQSWTAAVAADSAAIGAFPLSSTGLDSAGELTLSAGNYTAQPDGLRTFSGAAMIEFYDLG